MDDILVEASQVITRLGIYTLNGGLFSLYQFWWHLDGILTLGAVLLIALYFDREVAIKAAFTPRRYGRSGSATERAPRTAQVMTLTTAGLWFAAAALTEPPIPAIGTIMWLALVLGLLVMPQERAAILWRSKSAILVYSLAAIGFRLYLWQFNRLSPQDWARIVGTMDDAQAIIARNQGMFTTVASWFLWFLAPLGYLSLLVQRFTVNPMSLTAPWKSASEIIRDVRTREER